MLAGNARMIQNKNCLIGIQNNGGIVHVAGNVQSPSQKPTKLNEFSLPRLINTFKGRDKELEQLDLLFFHKKAKKVVISGLPGMGKTELAKQYANKCKKNGNIDHVFWIKAENKNDLENSSKWLKDLYQNLKEYKCLYIFDNTVSRQFIFELEPPSEANYYLLITSQTKDWNDDVKSLGLNHLTSDSAIDIFRMILKDYYKETDYKIYIELAKMVNNIPLGLQVTAAYVRQRMKCSGQYFHLQDYVNEISQNQHSYINLTIPECVSNPYTKSLYGAIKVSIDNIKREKLLEIRELALNALFICAFLDPERITFDDLLKMPNITEIMRNYKRDQNIVREALRTIDNYSFITYDPNSNEIKLHRFTQEILRYHMREYDSEIQCICYSACLEVLFNEFDSNCVFHNNYTIILKYADDNVNIFFNFYRKYKKKLFLNHDGDILDHILSWFIKRNCIESLKKILKDNYYYCILFNLIMCIHQRGRGTFKYISYYDLLHEAARYNNVDVMKLLVLEYNVNINKQNYYHSTPLHTAVYCGRFEAIEFLINNNADLNATNNQDETPLFTFLNKFSLHCQINKLNKILDLLKCEESIKNPNFFGNSVLHVIAGPYHPYIPNLVTLLATKYKLDVNMQNIIGFTPLHTLVIHSFDIYRQSISIRIVEAFKTCGARLDIKDKNGRTPLKLAQEKHIEFLVPYLIFESEDSVAS